MKLDTIFENEFNKLKPKKVRLKTDPANPVTGYEGYVLHEKSKFLKVHEGMLSAISSGLRKIGSGYEKLQRGSQKLQQLGQGDLGVLQDIGTSDVTYSEGQLTKMGIPQQQLFKLKNGTVPYITMADNSGRTYQITFTKNRFTLTQI